METLVVFDLNSIRENKKNGETGRPLRFLFTGFFQELASLPHG